MDAAEVTSDAPDTSKLIVEFYEEAVLDERESNGWDEVQYHPATGLEMRVRHPGQGHPVYRTADFIEIRIPMNLKEIRRREVRDSDKRNFARQWAAYQQTKQNPVFGTPIDKVPFLTKAQVLEFKGLGLRTAENIRDISDSDGQKLMGFQQLRKRVTDFLAALDGNAPIARLQSESEQKDKEIAALKAQMAEIVKQTEKRAK